MVLLFCIQCYVIQQMSKDIFMLFLNKVLPFLAIRDGGFGRIDLRATSQKPQDSQYP